MKTLFNIIRSIQIVVWFSFSLSTFHLQAQVFTQTVYYSGSIQNYTVPNCVTSLSLEAWGAQGGNITSSWLGGYGAYMSGVFTVSSGQVLKLLVGGQAPSFTACGSGSSLPEGTGGATGGGGGSFIATITNTPLLVAGGGGGRRCLLALTPSCNVISLPSTHGVISTSAQSSSDFSGAGGVNGNGGLSGEPTGGGSGGPGGGFYTNGGVCGTNGGTPGYAFINGGLIAPTCTLFTSSSSTGGGFGGGGAGCWCYRGTPGGGGGYSGGGSGVNDCGGGGGSSYNIGTNQINIGGVRTGNGQIVISYSLASTPISIIAFPTSICSGGSATLNTGGLVSYTWSTGSFSNAIVVSPTATSTYTVAGTNTLGCISSNSIVINVDGSTPNLSVVCSPSAVCPGNQTTIFANGANTYTISGGVANGIAFTPTANASYIISGTNGCGTSTAITSVSIFPAPLVTASINNPTLCLGNTAVVSASGALSYVWSGGISNNLAFSPPNSTAYTVTGTSSLGCSATAIVNVTVVPFAGTTVSALPTSTTICLGTGLAVSATGASTYSWSTGSNLSGITVIPASTTSYSVSGTNSFGCVSNAVIQVSVNATVPVLNIVTSSTSICPGTSISISATGAASYTFSGGTGNGIPFTPITSTVISISGANTCGTASTNVSITVNPVPSVTATALSPTLCSGNTETVIGSGASTYSWTGGVSNGIPFIPSSSGSYTLTGYSVYGCTASVVTNITVYPSPNNVPIATPSLICVGSSASLTGSGANNYIWFPGNFTTSIISVTPATSATYTLTKSNANCSDTQTISVTVNSLPTIIANASPSVLCLGSSAILLGSGGSTYSWTSGSAPLFGSSPAVSPTVSTSYTVSASDGTCTNTGTTSITVNPNPSISIVASSNAVCSGNSATLSGVGASNFSWTPTGLLGSTIVVSPLVTTQYIASVTNSFGCSSSVSHQITVNTLPLVNALASNNVICSGSSCTLTATGAGSYQWSTGALTPVTVVTPTLYTVYTLTGTTASGCSTVKSLTINVVDPVFSVSPSTAICVGASATLTAGGAISYTWSGSLPFSNIVVSPSITTIYFVSATTSSNGINCVGSQSVTVSVNPAPSLIASPSRSAICKGEKVTLTATGANTYTWSNGSSVNPLQVTMTSQSLYTVTGTDQNGCTGTASLSVKISACTAIEEQMSKSIEGIRIFPNPNKGEFTIQSGFNLDLTLVNDLGQKIREFQLNEKNDYKIEIKDLPKGIYFLSGKNADHRINENIVVLD